MFCRNCGKKALEDAEFCAFCGAKLSGPEQEPDMPERMNEQVIRAVPTGRSRKSAGNWEKRPKRLKPAMIVLILCVILVISIINILTKKGTCGENMAWILTIDGTLIIRGSGGMDNYFGRDNLDNFAPWYNSSSTIDHISIQDGITNIGNGAFLNCTNLTNVKISNNVTSIGDYAFMGCYNLNNVEIPNSVTRIGDSAFGGCGSLTSIEIPNSVTSIGELAFSGCGSLTSIEIPSSVTSIEHNTFNTNSSLTSIKIPISITSIGEQAFFNCHDLTDVYYEGSKDDWESIHIGTGNEELLDATIHFGGIPAAVRAMSGFTPIVNISEKGRR